MYIANSMVMKNINMVILITKQYYVYNSYILIYVVTNIRGILE